MRGTLCVRRQLGLYVLLTLRLRQVTREKAKSQPSEPGAELMEERVGSRRRSIFHHGRKRRNSFTSEVGANYVRGAQRCFCHGTLRVEITHFVLAGAGDR